MNKLARYIKPALLTVALFLFVSAANGAWATSINTGTSNASNIYTNQQATSTLLSNVDTNGAGLSVIQQVYNIIKFAYVFFYAVAVLLVAQSWMQFKQQKYDAMFASMGAALGLFLTPALIDFIHGLGTATANNGGGF